jgi:hypothetical protein
MKFLFIIILSFVFAVGKALEEPKSLRLSDKIRDLPQPETTLPLKKVPWPINATSPHDLPAASRFLSEFRVSFLQVFFLFCLKFFSWDKASLRPFRFIQI